ncbi:MAG: hypothetical protein EAZ37_12845 [Burkholderiales bacterium]|nr:MAG: hypothetical protein EAZ43_13755 [Betaproteobacteria bacterium]TAG25429.1 MAG: hypothetical protein EAZ37_12845 [Burkholderiales bacterium]
MALALASCGNRVLTDGAGVAVCPSAHIRAGCPPLAPREFRAAWVATVANIDWPSKPTLTSAEQRAEIVAIVDRAAELNLNALVLQIRTSADALYPSSLEPWSEFLTGAQGKAPSPLYDPLQLWIDEAHRRGIELHAWFNPYRARHTQAKSPNALNHIANSQPELVKSYGGFLWLDPGEPRAAQRTLDVIMDVVKRYDIDGVHIDDYFYPYPVVAAPEVRGALAAPGGPAGALLGAPASSVPLVPEREVEFPDEPSWQRYLATGGALARADWRRQNVNQLVEKIYGSIKREKAWVRFGVSPFGIGRPGKRPAGIAGFSQYDKLYADVELWLARGWLDYLAPQLYWPIAQQAQAFPVLLDYWHRENLLGRHVFPGLYTSQINDSARSWMPTELTEQIDLIRAKAPPTGHLHFSFAPLMQNRRGIVDALKRRYEQAALTPAAPWLSTTPLNAPLVVTVSEVQPNQRRSIAVESSSAPVNTKSVALWLRYGDQWQFSVVPVQRGAVGSAAAQRLAEIVVSDTTPLGALNSIAASAVDRFGNEGERWTLQVTQ